MSRLDLSGFVDVPSVVLPAASKPAAPARSTTVKAASTRPTPSPERRQRVAINVPGEVLEAIAHVAEERQMYLTEIVLEAYATHHRHVAGDAARRRSTVAGLPERQRRQRNVKYPTLLVAYLSAQERAIIDGAAAEAQLTRSAYVTRLLQAFTGAGPSGAELARR